jgi:transposase-like protein
MRKELGDTIRDIYQAPSQIEALDRLKKAFKKYEESASRFSSWLEENGIEGLTFYQVPQEHWKKIRTNNVSERLNQEIKRRTRVARLFPNEAACMRLVTAVITEIHEDWISGVKYLSI